MRSALAVLALALPLAGHAGGLDQGQLKVSFDRCVPSCDAAPSASYC